MCVAEMGALEEAPPQASKYDDQHGRVVRVVCERTTDDRREEEKK